MGSVVSYPSTRIFRVPEIWRYDGERLVILHLRDTE